MKKRIVCFMAAILLVVAATGCGEKSKNVKSNPTEPEKTNTAVNKTIISNDMNFKITVPSEWSETDKGYQVSGGNLELATADKSLVVSSVAKSSTQLTLDTLASTVLSNISSVDGTEINKENILDISVNGYKAKALEYTDVDASGNKVYCIIYWIETDNYLNQVLISGPAEDKSKLTIEFNSIINTFAEIK